jgi:hypothetical protein
MTRLFAFFLFISLAGQGTLLAQKPARPFKISFEEDGKEVVTNLNLRLNRMLKAIASGHLRLWGRFVKVRITNDHNQIA